MVVVFAHRLMRPGLSGGKDSYLDVPSSLIDVDLSWFSSPIYRTCNLLIYCNLLSKYHGHPSTVLLFADKECKEICEISKGHTAASAT